MTNDGTPIGYGFGWYTNVFPLLSTAKREQLLALALIYATSCTEAAASPITTI